MILQAVCVINAVLDSSLIWQTFYSLLLWTPLLIKIIKSISSLVIPHGKKIAQKFAHIQLVNYDFYTGLYTGIFSVYFYIGEET